MAPTSGGDDPESARSGLRQQLRSGAPEVTLSAEAARLLADELGRLQQSNERLRRQNRRLRRRLEAATGEVVPDPFEIRAADDAAAADEPEAP